MAYFLRFTDTASEDLDRGTSLLDLPSLDESVVLDGLCGYSFCSSEEIDYNMLSESEIEAKVNMYKNNLWYNGVAVLFEGDYIENNVNDEGVIFRANSIYKSF
jgi:hypothetical protein